MSRRLYAALLILGLALASLGMAMRVLARLEMDATERHLLAARPASPAVLPASVMPTGAPAGSSAAPVAVRLPALGLWNELEAVALAAQLDTDAGWDRHSGRPGQNGNVVLVGHSPSADPAIWPHSVFRQLAYLTPGERIEVLAGRHTYEYAVVTVFAIPAAEASAPEASAWIAPSTTERLTLVTCWPPHSAAYRVIVVAQPVRFHADALAADPAPEIAHRTD